MFAAARGVEPQCAPRSLAMILEDDDLRIRPVVLPDDVRLALPWYADPEVMDLSESSSEPYGEQTAAQILGWARASPP